jgi:integrase
LVFPKTEEKPPFQTWEEIERQVNRGGLSPADEKALWDSLFLTVPQIQEILEHVRNQNVQPFVYPMFCFAAYTGARRSEMLRCRVTDVDFEAKKILIREKKRGRGCRTTRHVPLSPFLAEVLRQWFASHPGGMEIFCQQLFISRSKAKRVNPSVATRNEVHDHFHRALQGSKWTKLRGWHVFRHSHPQPHRRTCCFMEPRRRHCQQFVATD